MFTIDSTIDAIQTGKKMWVNTFVTDTTTASALHKFIDAQSEYTKKATKAFTEVGTALAEQAAKSVQSFTKAK